MHKFQQLETIRCFAKNISNGKITLNNFDEAQNDFLFQILNFNKIKNQQILIKEINKIYFSRN